MGQNNPRQRIRLEETRYRGKNGSFVLQNEEHSVFFPDGSIVSRERKESPVAQGIVPHQPTDVVGQCQTCLEFLTADSHRSCANCSQVVCCVCARDFEKNAVCPTCAELLKRRRRILIVKKLLIYPFVQRVR